MEEMLDTLLLGGMMTPSWKQEMLPSTARSRKHRPQACAGDGASTHVPPHHIPSPSSDLTTKGVGERDGGHGPSARHVGLPRHSGFRGHALCGATSKPALAGRQGIVWRD